jgi:hypothetical protein
MDGETLGTSRGPRLRACRAIAASAVIVAVTVISIAVVQRVTELPAANLDYSVAIADDVHPATSNGRIAAIARHYLDQQTPDLAAPGIHQDPRIVAMTATFARTARDLEAGVPDAQVAAAPERIVWVVQVSGDLLNLRDLPWSRGSAPNTQGRLVIDDATGTILGVYPHFPGE